MRYILPIVFIFYTSLYLFSFSNKEIEPAEIIVSGNIHLVGNSPHEKIIIKTEENIEYTIIGKLADELFLYQNQTVEVTGILQKRDNLDVISFTVDSDPIYLAPARTLE